MAKDRFNGRASFAWMAFIAGLITFSLTGCSGSSGASDSEGPPTLEFSGSPLSIAYGGSSVLTWQTTGARRCEAAEGWAGAKGIAGTEEVGPLSTDTVFRLSCVGDGGAVTRQVTVTVEDGTGPHVSLTAEPAQIPVDGTTTLTWSSENVSSCTADGGWSGSRPIEGSFTTAPLTVTTSYRLACTGTGGTALAAVNVQVLDRTLRWVRPTENVDGTPLTDLSGYLIFWGTQSRTYQSSLRIDDPDATEWEADIAPGTYYFAMKSINSEGLQSDYSNEVVMTIP